jgi:hypothetical protein
MKYEKLAVYQTGTITADDLKKLESNGFLAISSSHPHDFVVHSLRDASSLAGTTYGIALEEGAA